MTNPVDWAEAPVSAEAAYGGCNQMYMAWYRRGADGAVEQICPESGARVWTSIGGRKDFPYGHELRPIFS